MGINCSHCGWILRDHGGAIGVVTLRGVTVKTVYYCDNSECTNKGKLCCVEENSIDYPELRPCEVPGAEGAR